MNRSVELVWRTEDRPGVRNRERWWSMARTMLEARVGAVVGGDADQMWTPTRRGVHRMMPRMPLFEDGVVPDHYGDAVPAVVCTDRPASACMPPGEFVTLGQMLESRWATNSLDGTLDYELTRSTVEAEVAAFIARANNANTARRERAAHLQAQSAMGFASALIRDMERYRQAERAYFFNDPTCMLRYLR